MIANNKNLRLSIVLIVLFISTSLFAQNANHFKTLPILDGSEPEWVTKMYADAPNIFEVSALYDAYYRVNTFKKSVHTQNYKYWVNKVENFIDDDGFVTEVAKQNFLENEKQLFNLNKSSTRTSTANWINIGPDVTYLQNGSLEQTPTQVHVNSFCVAPSNNNIILAAASGGGLFKSTDKGLNWLLIAKDEIIISANDIKIHPTNPDIMYLGYGDAIYKSVDGGYNWNEIFVNTGGIEQLLIHKTTPNIIFAATQTGLLKSTDSGATWTMVVNTKCWDIVSHATDNSIYYLAISNTTLKQAEVYKSTDTGDTWTLKNTNWYAPTDINNASDSGCKLATTPADPNRLYAALIGSSKVGDHGWIGVYYSLDNADTWVNADGMDGGPYVSGNDPNTNWYYAGYFNTYTHQGWYNFDLAVSHTNPDKIWVGTVKFMESNNRGANMESVRNTRSLYMHNDIQDMQVIGSEIWIASDGGLNYSDDECQTMSVRNTGLSASNFWGFTQGWNEDTWSGGRYHNGNGLFHENYGVGNTIYAGGAEQATGYVNPLNNRKFYYSDVYDKLAPDALNQSTTSQPSISIYPNESYLLLNSSEIEFDPRYGNVMFLGKDNTFYKSTDEGQTFTGLFSFADGSRVLEFEISRANPDVIFCLVKVDGKVRMFRSENGGNTFTQRAIPFLKTRGDITLDAATTDHLWVADYAGSFSNKIYESTDGGISWTNRTTSTISAHKIEDLVYQLGSDNVVYIFTDTGLFYWDNTASDWVTYDTGLPFKKRGLKMIPFYRDGKLRFAGGRGVWESPLAAPSMPVAQPITKESNVYCHRTEIQFEDFSAINHNGASWLWQFPGANMVSSNTARNPLVTYNTPGTYDVILTVTDALGNSDTKTVTDMIIVEDDVCGLDLYADQAMSFSSDNNQYLKNTDVLIPNVTDFTFTGWIKPNGIQDNIAGIFSLSSGSGNEKNVLNFKSNNTLGFHWNGGQYNWNSNLVVPENEWSYVAMTISSTGLTLYVNEQKATKSFTPSAFELNRIILGAYYTWGSRDFNGEMDELTFYTRALSEDEIRLSRHLTKQDVSDPDLVAYYQFNSYNGQSVYDKKSTYDLQSVNAPVTIASSAPVGPGVSEALPVTSSGISNFTIPGVNMQFASGVVPDGDVVVTRVNTLPFATAVNPSLGDYYWVVNNYGTNSNFTGLDAITFSNVGDQSNITANAISLFKRQSNSALDSDWNQVGVATQNNVGAETISFNTNTITSFSQLYLANTNSLSVGDFSETKGITAYPNPLNNGNSLYFSGIETPTVFTLFSIDGKQIIRQELGDANAVKIPTVTTGMYFYTLVSSAKIEKGKLLVK